MTIFESAQKCIHENSHLEKPALIAYGAAQLCEQFYVVKKLARLIMQKTIATIESNGAHILIDQAETTESYVAIRLPNGELEMLSLTALETLINN